METDMTPREIADRLEAMAFDAELSGHDKNWLTLSKAVAFMREFEQYWHTKQLIREIQTWDSSQTITKQ